MNRFPRGSALVLALGLAAAGAQAAPNLLTNGSFENPGCAFNCILGNGSTFITGWTTFLSGVEYYSAGLSAADGVMVVDLANYVFSNGGLMQTFATTPLAHYTLSFAAGNVQASGRTGDGLVRVEVGDVDQTFATATAYSGAYAWRRIDVDFVAQGTSTTLKFSNTQNSFTHFALIDAVGVASAVPEPASSALLLGGAALLAAARRRRRA